MARVSSGLLPLIFVKPATTDSSSDLDGAAAAAEEKGGKEWEVPICHDGYLAVEPSINTPAAATLHRELRGA